MYVKSAEYAYKPGCRRWTAAYQQSMIFAALLAVVVAPAQGGYPLGPFAHVSWKAVLSAPGSKHRHARA